jgi:hypothetical protein
LKARHALVTAIVTVAAATALVGHAHPARAASEAPKVTAASSKCAPVRISHPRLAHSLRHYHRRYLHWRHAMHKPSKYGFSHPSRSCSVPYVRWARDLWQFRARRAYLHYLRYEKAQNTAPHGTPVQIGRQLAAKRGWVGSNWTSLYLLWNRESGWNPNALNASSGACGIPQALPCSKIADHSTAGQIEWGLGYIASVYGSPDAAWAHSEAFGWY